MRAIVGGLSLAALFGLGAVSGVRWCSPAPSRAGGQVRMLTTGESCAASKDLVAQALERMGGGGSDAQLDDAVQLLKRSTDLCSESGDAWYYRGLVEAKLNHKPKAEYAMSQAKRFPSEAKDLDLNPFVLATPDARSVLLKTGVPEPKVGQGESTGKSAQKWALVIGISQFGDQGIRALQYTTQDADAFAQALKDPAIGQFPADNVRELTDAQATGKNIKAQVNWIARHAEPNDVVVIYVATHGSPRSMDSVAGVNYLVTYDTEMFHAGTFDEDAMYATALPMVELANAVATRMRSLRTLVILDTCYSGGSLNQQPVAAKLAQKSAGPPKQMLERMSQGTGRVVMAASRADEESLESSSLGHGYFTYYLLDALKAGGGKVPLSQLFATVSANVSKRAAAAGAQQHPVLYKSSESADFTLQAVASSTASEAPESASTTIALATPTNERRH